MTKRLLPAALALALAAVSAHERLQGQTAVCALPSSYALSELPGIGGPITESVALNDLGQAAGRALDAAWRSRAVAWTGGNVVNISGSAEGAAHGISSAGQIAGWRGGSSGMRAFVRSGSSTRILAPLPGDVASLASDVNRSGTAVGWSTNSIGDARAVVWRNGVPTNLAAGGSQRPSISLAFAINDANQIVGRGDFAVRPFRRALLWDSSGMRALPDSGGGYASASAISDNGTYIAGGSLDATDSKYHAVLWHGGAIRDLGLLDGAPTAAYGVNDCGTAVGDAVVDVATDRFVAVVFQNGLVRELNDLIPGAFDWDLVTARAINNRGEIVGFGFRSGFPGQRGFLLTPQF